MKEFAGKHIIFIVENCSVPFDKRVWREAIALIDEGARISIICPKGVNQDRERFIKINNISIYRYTLPINVYSKLGYINEYIKALLFSFYYVIKIQIRTKIHAIHVANPPDIFFPLALYSKLFGIKFIFDHHDLSPESFSAKFNRKGFLFRLMLLFEYLTFKTSDFIITTNESLKKMAILRGKVEENKIQIVRNGPDSKFRDIKELEERQPVDFKYLASYIGIMGSQDGVDNIISAVDIIVNKKNRRDIKFILIGTGDQFELLREKAIEKQLIKFIEFTGRISDESAKLILANSDICLAPDPKNNLNEFHTMNKIAEYMGFGKPIVSFDLDETRFTAGESALYVLDNNILEFANSIIRLIDNPDLRLKMGKIGKDRLIKNFTWEHSKINLIKAYRHIFQL